MLGIVYLLCALTSLACAVLLWRGWRQSGARLLLWSALCFVGLFLNNVLLIVDTRLLPQYDLAVVRMIPALLGALALVYGLVFDSE
jgi:hypothetical protein